MQLQMFYKHLLTNGIDESFLQKIREEWDHFINNKPVNLDIIPSEIYSSWMRSKSYGVDPYSVSKASFLDNSRLKDFTNYQKMTEKYQNFIKGIEIFVNKDDFTIQIFDQTGKSNYNYLNNDYLSYELQGNLIGIDLAEKLVGTTAPILALTENIPILVLKNQHYLWQHHEINCCAAPIHNSNQEIIGAINIIFGDIKLAKKAYLMVKSFATIFDLYFSSITENNETDLLNILDNIQEGIIYLNEENTMQYYNQKLLDLLQINKNGNIQLQIKKNIHNISFNNISKTTNKRISLEINGVQKKFWMAQRLITNDRVNNTNKLVSLREDIESSLPMINIVNKLVTFRDILGNDLNLREAKTMAMHVADTDVPVLLYGENGSGKEMFAQAIHSASSRKNRPFVVINCGAIPAELVESELFGYEEGAFTGALKGGKVGIIESASSGTLFLDEIESLPLYAQVKLLRVLANGRIMKIGGTKEIIVDIRIISASKKDLLEEADKNLFREDLYYRLSTFIIKIPALREHSNDIDLLTQQFVLKYGYKYNKQNILISDDFSAALKCNEWRGNIRELDHVIESAFILLRGKQTLSLQHLPEYIQRAYNYKNTKHIIQERFPHYENKQGLLAIAEEIIIENTLETVGGNISAAAEKLGINRKTIYNKMQEYPSLRRYITR